MNRYIKHIGVISIATAVVACGGGSGGAGPVEGPLTADAQGIWFSAKVNNVSRTLVFFSNGESWATIDDESAAIPTVTILSGQSTSLEGSKKITSSLTGANAASPGTVQAATFTAEVTTAKSRVQGALLPGGSDEAWKYDANFDARPLDLAQAAGVHEVEMRSSGEPHDMLLTIDEDGTFTLQSDTPGDENCQATGKISLGDPGKQVGRLSLTFAGNSCPLTEGTKMTGTFRIFIQANPLVEILALSEDKRVGMVVGSRSNGS